MNQTAVFDLKDILQNELIGDVYLFIIVGMIAIWLCSAKYKFPMSITILLSIWWLVVCFALNQGLVILWFFALLMTGFTFYYSITKVMIK